MADHVNGLVADVLTHQGEGRLVVVQGHVVQGEAVGEQVVRMAVAHAVVEAPHIAVTMVEQVTDQVVVLRHDEHVARGRQTVDDENRFARLAPLETQRGQAQFVLCVDVVGADLGVLDSVEGVQRDFTLHG